jgi:hypothetical protein
MTFATARRLPCAGGDVSTFCARNDASYFFDTVGNISGPATCLELRHFSEKYIFNFLPISANAIHGHRGSTGGGPKKII